MTDKTSQEETVATTGSETPQQAPAGSETRPLAAPLAMYAVVAVAMVAVIIVTAIKLNDELQALSGQMAAVETETTVAGNDPAEGTAVDSDAGQLAASTVETGLEAGEAVASEKTAVTDTSNAPAEAAVAGNSEPSLPETIATVDAGFSATESTVTDHTESSVLESTVADNMEPTVPESSVAANTASSPTAATVEDTAVTATTAAAVAESSPASAKDAGLATIADATIAEAPVRATETASVETPARPDTGELQRPAALAATGRFADRMTEDGFREMIRQQFQEDMAEMQRRDQERLTRFKSWLDNRIVRMQEDLERTRQRIAEMQQRNEDRFAAREAAIQSRQERRAERLDRI